MFNIYNKPVITDLHIIGKVRSRELQEFHKSGPCIGPGQRPVGGKGNFDHSRGDILFSHVGNGIVISGIYNPYTRADIGSTGPADRRRCWQNSDIIYIPPGKIIPSLAAR